MPRITQLCNQFRETLAELQRQAGFFSRARRLIRHSEKVFRWDDYDRSTRRVVIEFHEGKVLPEEQIYEALYVLMCSHFEGYIRKMLREAVAFISGKIKHFDDLDPKMQRDNLILTGRALSLIDRDKRAAALNYFEFAKNLGSCIPGSNNFVLNSDLFAFFLKGASPKQIKDAYSVLGINGFWDDVGRNKEIKKITNETSIRKAGKKSRYSITEHYRQKE